MGKVLGLVACIAAVAACIQIVEWCRYPDRWELVAIKRVVGGVVDSVDDACDWVAESVSKLADGGESKSKKVGQKKRTRSKAKKNSGGSWDLFDWMKTAGLVCAVVLLVIVLVVGRSQNKRTRKPNLGTQIRTAKVVFTNHLMRQTRPKHFVLYHGTSLADAQEIAARGFIAGTNNAYLVGAYFARSFEVAKTFTVNGGAVVRVLLPWKFNYVKLDQIRHIPQQAWSKWCIENGYRWVWITEKDYWVCVALRPNDRVSPDGVIGMEILGLDGQPI